MITFFYDVIGHTLHATYWLIIWANGSLKLESNKEVSKWFFLF